MPNIQRLLENYQRYVVLPWQDSLSHYESIWFAIYPPEKERKLLLHFDAFQIATSDAGKDWQAINLHGYFTRWLENEDPEERSDMFKRPQDLEFFAKGDFSNFLAKEIEHEFSKAPNPDSTVFAIYGLIELYDYIEVSELIESLEKKIQGRLLIFFPGFKEDNTYRFLNARSGWDYLAVSIDSNQELFV